MIGIYLQAADQACAKERKLPLREKNAWHIHHFYACCIVLNQCINTGLYYNHIPCKPPTQKSSISKKTPQMCAFNSSDWQMDGHHFEKLHTNYICIYQELLAANWMSSSLGLLHDTTNTLTLSMFSVQSDPCSWAFSPYNGRVHLQIHTNSVTVTCTRTAPLFNLPVPDLPQFSLISSLHTLKKAPPQPGKDSFLLISWNTSTTQKCSSELLWNICEISEKCSSLCAEPLLTWKMSLCIYHLPWYR